MTNNDNFPDGTPPNENNPEPLNIDKSHAQPYGPPVPQAPNPYSYPQQTPVYGNTYPPTGGASGATVAGTNAAPTYGQPTQPQPEPQYSPYQQPPQPPQVPYGAPVPPYNYNGPHNYSYPAPKKYNALAIASFVIGLAQIALFWAWIPAPLAVIFGHIALSQIKKSQEEGKTFALIGLILGYIGLGIMFLFVFFILLAGFSDGWYDNSYSDYSYEPYDGLRTYSS